MESRASDSNETSNGSADAGSASDAGSSTTTPGSAETLAADEWRRRAQQLIDTITRVGSALKRFSKIPNRAVFYDLHPYFADAHSVLLVVRHYINWLGISFSFIRFTCIILYHSLYSSIFLAINLCSLAYLLPLTGYLIDRKDHNWCRVPNLASFI